MNAALFNKPHKIDLVDYSLPKLLNNEVLIKVAACGVCGTDFHIYEGKAPSNPPVILGHEYTGEVVEKGKDIDLNIGDHVAVNPNIHCGYCRFCRSGKINLCINLKALGVTINGGFSQYSIVPLSQVYLLPKDFPLEQAAFSEPLSCCIHGIEQSSIKLNDSVIIIGAGTIGLLMIQLAKLKGASKIIAVDISKNKLKIAERSGADYLCDPNEDKFLEKIYDITSGGANVAIECAGNEKAVKTALDVVAKGGIVTIFGLSNADAYLKLNLQSFFHKEITIKSSLLNPFTFQTAVDLLVLSKVKVDLFETSLMNLDENGINKIFNGSKNDSVIKYMVIPHST